MEIDDRNNVIAIRLHQQPDFFNTTHQFAVRMEERITISGSSGDYSRITMADNGKTIYRKVIDNTGAVVMEDAL